MKCRGAEVPRAEVLRPGVPGAGGPRYVGPNVSSERSTSDYTMSRPLPAPCPRNRSMKKRLQAGVMAGGAAIGLAITSAAAQQPADQPVFRTSTTAAVVDVIVRDRT